MRTWLYAIFASVYEVCRCVGGPQDNPFAHDASFGFGSCLMTSKFLPHERQGFRPFRVLDELVKHTMDSFVFIGDAVYADFPLYYSTGCCSSPPSPTCDPNCFINGTIGRSDQIDQHYRMLFDDAHFRRFVENVPVVFTWDDHELFDNYREGMDYPYYALARAAFEKHLAKPFNPEPYRAGTMYFIHHVPRRPALALADMFVLDGRSYRSRTGLLGETQLQDLETWLKTSREAPWRFVVSSTMFAEVASGVGSDNWSKYRDEKRRVMDMLYDSGSEGLVLLSGDAHFAAVVQHHAKRNRRTCKIVEVASSPIAAVALRPTARMSSFNGHAHGFNEEVNFLESGEHLYATALLNATTAVFRLWKFDERAVHEKLLVEAVIRRQLVCSEMTSDVTDSRDIGSRNTDPTTEL